MTDIDRAEEYCNNEVPFDRKASEDSTLKGGIPRSLKFLIFKQLTNYKE